MIAPSSRSSDLLIGLSLAELFLLFILLLWLSVSREADAHHGAPPTLTEAELQDANSRLQATLKDLKARVDSLESDNRELHELEKIVQSYFPDAPSGARNAAIESALATASGRGRGKGKCQDSNLLLEVRVVDGHQTLRVLTTSRDVLKELGVFNNARPDSAPLIQEETQIRDLLSAIAKYNARHDCVFDYRLYYRTSHDFLYAKHRYEKYCFPAGDDSIPG